MRRHELVRGERVLCLEHLACKVAHHRLDRDVEIAEHLVRPPPSKEADDVRVHVGDKESSGTCRSERANRDFGWQEAEVGADVRGLRLEVSW